MSAGFRAPPRPADGATVLVSDMITTLTPGRCGACCVCGLTCWLWWSPRPPSGYVPLHGQCVLRLIEHWRTAEVIAVLATSGAPRTGAYARKASAEVAQDSVVVLDGRRAAVLPDGFTPGPFWQPGDDAHTPWVTLAETAAGHLAYPAQAAEAYARATCALLRRRGRTDRNIPVVGASVVSPEGAVTTSWGSPPVPSRPRWLPVTQIGQWTLCHECGDARWPGSWMNFLTLTCLDCLAKREGGDPRPSFFEPGHPGDRYVPERFTKLVKPLRPLRSSRRR